MPFKTRKQKIISNKRRITISEMGLATYASDSKLLGNEKEVAKQKEDSGNLQAKNYLYVNKEIFKITLLALIIIGLQLFLKVSNIIF